MAYTPTNDIGRIRLLVSDIDDNNRILEDADYQALLDLEGNVHAAAGQALLTIAGSETLRLKLVQTQGLTVDGVQLGRELRMQAQLLFDRAERHDADGDDGFLLAGGHRVDMTPGWWW